jgi:UDP-2,3-diacylglucosamine pyrophosphatase LpxH
MIIVCGDWHIGFKKANYVAIDHILDVIEESHEDIEMLILNGDTVDTWRAKYDDIKKNETFKHLQRVTKNVRTIFILGNHDYTADDVIGDDLNVEYKRVFVHDNICYLHGDQFSYVQIESLFAFITRKMNFLSRWINSAPAKTTIPKAILKRINKFSENNFFEHIIVSHYHCPYIFKTLIFTGDAINYPSYLEVTEDSIKMKIV